ncbi:MAG: hypothetical protein IIZ44_11270 [Muribaculaceae bacterium]|nr:hypothetical protein [Muribaculaceae bacterium]
MSVTILGIESSCDDTSAAVLRDTVLLSNVIASQRVHEAYGGVVPELASRAHQQNIVPVVSEAIRQAGIDRKDIDAIAFTRGPGLPGSLHVGTSFAKGLALALDIPLVDVNHLHGHVLSHFVKEEPDAEVPDFPYLCLLISGGNSRGLLDALREACPYAGIFVEGMLPADRAIAAKANRPNRVIRDFNSRVEALAAEYGMPYLDVYSAYEDRGGLNSALTEDGIHLKDDAFGPWAEIVRPYLEP